VVALARRSLEDLPESIEEAEADLELVALAALRDPARQRLPVPWRTPGRRGST